MLADHPAGWHHRLLRLEPMHLIGRPGDPAKAAASLHERPIEVFADAPGSGLCLAVIRRASNPAFLFEFDSYAIKYAEAGLPVHSPAELQPCYPWSIAPALAQPSATDRGTHLDTTR